MNERLWLQRNAPLLEQRFLPGIIVFFANNQRADDNKNVFGGWYLSRPLRPTQPGHPFMCRCNDDVSDHRWGRKGEFCVVLVYNAIWASPLCIGAGIRPFILARRGIKTQNRTHQ